MADNYVSVFFTNLSRTVEIHKFTFNIYDSSTDRNGASRVQIPLRLAYAFTVHRAQGLTLDRVEIDCNKMSQPGHIGVALGRARNKKGLRVLNFNPKLLISPPALLISPPAVVTEFYKGKPSDQVMDVSCCRINIREHLSSVSTEMESTASNDPDCESEMQDESIWSCYDEDNEEEVLLAALEAIDHLVDTEDTDPLTFHDGTSDHGSPTRSALDAPTADVVGNHQSSLTTKLAETFQKCRHSQPITQKQRKLNAHIDYFETHEERTTTFAADVHQDLYALFLHEIPSNQKVTNKQETSFHKEVILYQTSQQYLQHVSKLFNVNIPNASYMRPAL